jgi:hypothetical protein
LKSNNQLEQDLAKLGKSMTPQATFISRVMQEIQQTQTPVLRYAEEPGQKRWWIPISLSLAASMVIGFSWMLHNTPTKPATDDPVAQLVNSSTEWQTVSDRPVTLVGDVPAREVSRQKFERTKWIDPQRHTTFERVVPREKVIFVTMESY